MAAIPIEHRYTVEGGRIIHRILMQDSETGVETPIEVDAGAAPAGATEGQDLTSGETDRQLTGNDPGGRTAPLQGTETAQDAQPQGLYQNALGFGSGGPRGQFGNDLFNSGPFSSGLGGFGMGQGAQGGNVMADPTRPYANNTPAAAGTNLLNPTNAAMNPANSNPGNTPGLPGDMWQRASNMGRFSVDNPDMAMSQVMMDMGMQPFNKLNPFVQMIQRAATGLASAFLINNANNSANTIDPANPTAPADMAGMFGNFLKNALSSGTVFSQLGAAAPGLNSAIQTYRNQQANGGGGTGAAVNPFLEALMTTLSSQGGAGATGVLASLYGPTMPRSLFQGYTSGLEGALANATKGYWSQEAPNGTPGTDFMKYLLKV